MTNVFMTAEILFVLHLSILKASVQIALIFGLLEKAES